MERRGKSFSKSRILILIFFLFFLIWMLLQFLGPIFITSGTVTDLSGQVFVDDNQEANSKIPFPWSIVYDCGDSLCHQKASRSFFINDNQMPFCARCTSIWLGLAIGLGFIFFYKIELDTKLLFIVLIAIVPIGIDGLGQLFGLWESTNISRLITGLFIGIVSGISIGIIIDEVKEIVTLKKNKN